MPCVSATIRSRTRSSSGPVIVESSSARASPSTSPPRELRQPFQPGPRSAHDAAAARPAPPASGARRTRASAQHLIEPLRIVDEADQRLLRGHLGHHAEHGQTDPEAIRGRSDAPTERRPRASRCGGGSRSRNPASVPRACSPANASSASDSTPAALATWQPVARSSASSSTAVLPTPLRRAGPVPGRVPPAHPPPAAPALAPPRRPSNLRDRGCLRGEVVNVRVGGDVAPGIPAATLLLDASSPRDISCVFCPGLPGSCPVGAKIPSIGESLHHPGRRAIRPMRRRESRRRVAARVTFSCSEIAGPTIRACCGEAYTSAG